MDRATLYLSGVCQEHCGNTNVSLDSDPKDADDQPKAKGVISHAKQLFARI
jgi:hypothetical protein